MTTTTADYATWNVGAYSNLLEDCTGYTVRVATDDEGEHCYELVDAYGDAEGDPWYAWADLVHDTEDAIAACLRELGELHDGYPC
jgi:hypothetical protein